MRLYTRELYERILPEETGMSCGYMPVGFVELACDPGRLEYYRRAAALYRHLGGEVAEISPGMVAERCLIIDTSDVLAGFHVRRDGRANPTDATMAFAQGSKDTRREGGRGGARVKFFKFTK